MARRSSSRSSPAPSRSAPAPARSAPAPARQAPPPAPAHHAPAPAPAMSAAPQSGGMLSGLGATMVQGLAWGTGTAVARHAVDSVFDSFSGNKNDAPAQQAAPAAPAAPQMTAGPCDIDRNAFVKCLQENPTNAANCDFYFNALQACQGRSF